MPSTHSTSQVGAVFGNEFSYELLHAVHPVAGEDLQRSLRNLADAELLYVRGIAPDATYQFKHALIRDAAYEDLLRSRRKELHLIVARTIDAKFPPQSRRGIPKFSRVIGPKRAKPNRRSPNGHGRAGPRRRATHSRKRWRAISGR